MRASSSGFLVRAASRLEIRFSKLLICAGSAADQDYRRTRYLSVGPAWDTVPAANLLQDGGAHAEFLGNVVDGQVKVTREVLEAHALCYGLVGGHGGGGASGATARVSLGQVTFGPKKLAEGKNLRPEADAGWSRRQKRQYTFERARPPAKESGLITS